MVDMTEKDKMMLRWLIVKEDELERTQMELESSRTNGDYETKWMRTTMLERKAARLVREIEELKEKLEEVCGE